MFSKAQASLEYMMVLGVIIIIVIPLFYYGVTETSSKIRINQADDTVNTLAKAADSVYSLGPGTKKYVYITIPKGVETATLNEKEIMLKLQIFGGKSDIVASTKALLVGTIPSQEGNYLIALEALDSGAVRIGNYDDTDYPTVIYTFPSGTINYQNVILRANTDENANCRYNETSDASYTDMGDNFLGSGQTHEDYLFLAGGEHTFYVRCRDAVGNTMPASATITFTIVPEGTGGPGGNGTGNDTLEYNAPTVKLISPPNDTVENQNKIAFIYNVTDASSISYCNLIIDHISLETDSVVIRNQQENFTRNMERGNYSWSISCTDVWNNTGSSQTWWLAVNTTLDTDTPRVYLQEPLNDTLRNFWLVSFEYNVTDTTSNISYCMLYLQPHHLASTYSYKDEKPPEGLMQSIIFPLPGGNYTWNVNCTDDSSMANVGISQKRLLRINISEGAGAYITSCAGWCGFEGQSGGFCAPNPNWCGSGCGLPYYPARNCYASLNASQLYCQAGGWGDACCCTP